MIEISIEFINKFFMYYIFIYAIIFFISTIFSMLELNKQKRKEKFYANIQIEEERNHTPISILVPAYNEEETILDCIESLMFLDYPTYEIIVIDDGSNDETSKKVIERYNLNQINRPIRKQVSSKKTEFIYEGAFSRGVKLTVVRKENGGKADALNMGINLANYPLFASLDADSILQRDSLKKIVNPFNESNETIAAGGNIKVANQVVLEKGKVIKILPIKKLLVMFQTIEYYRVFLTTRVWFNRFNGNLIISGAFGLFRKSAVLNVGGYDVDTIGEDMELVVKLHSFYRKNKIPYKIQYVHDAICWSQMPERIRDLKGQRRRWHIGLLSSLSKHRYIFLNPKYGLVGMFSFLYFVMYELLSCIIDIFGVGIIVLSYFKGYLNIDFLITFLIIYIAYGTVISITSIILENYIFKYKTTTFATIKLLIFSLLENVGYRQLSAYFRLTGLIGYRKRKKQWGKIKRSKQNKASKDSSKDSKDANVNGSKKRIS